MTKLLLDQNISHKLVKELSELYPGINHVYLLKLHTATDEEIWKFAQQNHYTIATFDSDFNERSTLYGHPPKVIWLKTGNIHTRFVHKLLIKHQLTINQFIENRVIGCLQIYD